jgi:hypothetical protein
MTSTSGHFALYAAGQQTVTIAGTARDEAQRPYPDRNTVQARAVGGPQDGQVVATTKLNNEANFSLPNLPAGNYTIELVVINPGNGEQRIVCTEGPFAMTQQLLRNDVVIDCGKVPVAWWLLGAAGAAGITAGILAANASPSQ